MNDKKENPVIGYLAGFLIAAALGGAYILLVGPIGPSRPTGDDDPIVVAGGSLKIGSRFGFDPDLSDHQKATHKDKNRTVRRLEIECDASGQRCDEFYVSGKVNVDIEYCPDDCKDTTKKPDIVTFNSPNGKKLTVSNSDTSHPIGDEAKLNSNLIDHQPNQPNQGRVKQIIVSGDLDHTPDPSYPCKGGLCKVTLHYWCGSNVVNACK
jgi:hypothetical protein